MQIVETAAQADAWLTRVVGQSGPFGFDTETEGINPKKQPAAGDHGRVACFTVANLTDEATFFWATPEVVSVMGPWWSQAPVVGHNLYGFDAHLCRRAGYPLGNIVMDTLRAHRLIDTDPDAEHGLKALMRRYLGIEPVGAFAELFTRKRCLEVVEQGEPRRSWRKVDGEKVPTLVGGPASRFGELTELVPLSEIRTTYTNLLADLVRYACLDAVATLKLYQLFSERMRTTGWANAA